MKRSLTVLFVLALSLGGFAHAQCAAFPCVVATVSLTNQDQAISSTPIFIPATSGMFRISGYISTSTGTNKRAIWTDYLGWTDNHGTKEFPFLSATRKSAQGQVYTFQGIAGQPLLYQTKLTGGGGGSGGMTYDLFITAEQLQ